MKDLDKFIAECEKNARPDSEINTSDIPALTDEQLRQMKPSHLVRREFYKPIKKSMTIRLDADSLDYLQHSGAGWQTRLNDYIRHGIASGQL